jgi:hypothetical protein
MTQKEKELFFKDLSGRLPYTPLGLYKWKDEEAVEKNLDGTLYDRLYLQLCVFNTDQMSFKPYLRPLSSITEDEKNELEVFGWYVTDTNITYCGDIDPEDEYSHSVTLQEITWLINWLNKHNFDYRGLIPMGLALEEPEYMLYNHIDHE